jgi:hypothetical protein
MHHWREVRLRWEEFAPAERLGDEREPGGVLHAARVEHDVEPAAKNEKCYKT